MNKLLIVDLDKTLIFGDSVVALSMILINRGSLASNFWDRKTVLDSDSCYFSLVKKQELSTSFYSLSKEDQILVIDLLLEMDEVKPISQTIVIINGYRNSSFKILVTSASLDFLVLPILERLQFKYDYLHCSSFQKMSSESVVLRPNNSGISKLQAIKDHYNLYGVPEEVVVFSDHFSDLPILLMGHKSFVVKNTKNTIDDWSNFFDFESIYHN